MKLLFFAIVGCLFHQATSQTDCITGTDVVGANVDPRAKSNTGDSTYTAFLAISEVVQCHGIITAWTIYYGRIVPGACHNMRLQVWRPVSGDTYELVGQNVYDFVSASGCAIGVGPRSFTFNVPEALWIPVMQGDVIGWVDEGATSEARIVMFDEAFSGSNQYGIVRAQSSGSECVSASIGATCNWAEVGQGGTAVHLVRDYSLQATLGPTNDPIIVNLPTNSPVEVKEHQPAGQFVYTVIGNNRWTGEPTIPPPLTYSLTDDGGGMFQIDPATGVISTTAELDFETLDNYALAVTVTDGPSLSATETLDIAVADVNEPHTIAGLPPRVDRDADNTGANVLLGTATYTDLDDDAVWPAKTYFMVASDPTMQHLFKIEDFGTNPVQGQVRTARDLEDWLGNDRVELSVYCTDGTFTSGPMVMEVVITNQRQKPIFTNLPATVSIPEDSGTNTDIMVVVAEVPNRDPVGYGYKIGEVYPLAPFDTWQFWTGASGRVRTHRDPFDYFTCNRYNVEMAVNDGYYDAVPKNITVDITWVNQPPVWNQGPYTSTILEKTVLGTALPDVFLDASDRDVPQRDWISYSLLDNGGSGAHLFSASNITHLVTVSGEVIVPDNSDTRTINMIVHVRDAATESDDTLLTVTVIDINDKPPVFDPKHYEGTVNETHVGGEEILDVGCTDKDGPKNSQLTYKVLEPEAFKYFEVTNNQKLVLKQPISYLDHPTINFTVLAMDSGTPMLNDTATFFITVIDENMHRPEFEEDGFYNLEVRSDVSVGDVVASITAVDLDLPETSPVTYFLLKPDEYFSIGGDSGDIIVRKGVGRGQSHLLYVYAYDSGDLYSDPCVVRLDIYSASGHLVDIHLQYPLEDFKQRHDEFIALLNQQLAPWIVKLESARLDGSPQRSIARIYALQDDSAATIDDLEVKKKFVSEDALFKALSTGVPGTPRDWLRGPTFSEFQPMKIVPAYPVWLVDTVGGIIMLTLLCVAAVAAVVGLLYMCKKQQWLCFKNKVVPKDYPAAEPPMEEQFELGYSNKTYGRPTTYRPTTYVPPSARAPPVRPAPDPPLKHHSMEKPPTYAASMYGN